MIGRFSFDQLDSVDVDEIRRIDPGPEGEAEELPEELLSHRSAAEKEEDRPGWGEDEVERGDPRGESACPQLCNSTPNPDLMEVIQANSQ